MDEAERRYERYVVVELNAVDVIASSQAEDLHVSEELAKKYSLDVWASEFSLMTAGYRDPLDPANASSTDVPFNVVTVAVFVEAKARVFERKVAAGEQCHVHIGGETRPHTQTFIEIAARIYSAHGVKVHLRRSVSTSPIWYSSFGVFFEEYQSGDNFTASHSQYFKGGWKPLDQSGQQLLEDEAAIVAEVRAIVANRETIRLETFNSNPLIAEDFDVDTPYLKFQQSVVPDDLIRRIADAGRQGFRVSVCTMGGSMRATSERFFARLDIPTGPDGIVNYFMSEEDSGYHGIGSVDGTDIGVDPGKPQIFRKLVAPSGLIEGKADLTVLWDPDGDRLNVLTKAPASVKEAARAAGLTVDDSVGDKCIVYFTPNQLYLLLTAFRIEVLRDAGQLHDRDWFVGMSYATTTSLEELARAEGLNCIRVPVGFKYIGDMCSQVERQLNGGDVVFETTVGDRVNLGRTPRALILCEESGGATMGGAELLKSRSGKHSMLALREKDAMQLGLLSMCLGATLYTKGSSFAEHYCDLVARKGLKCIHFKRNDVLLYDEGLTGSALRAAKDAGVEKRDRVMDFFGRLADEQKAGRLSLEEVRQAIVDRARHYAGQLPALTRACRAGDDLLHGMLFEFENLRFIVRPSGTDALLRYYVESTDSATVKAVQTMVQNLEI